MSLDTLIMFLGALTALLPFLGFPNSWDKIIFLVVGVIIIVLGIMVRRRGKSAAAPRVESRERTFAEHTSLHSHDAS